MKARWQETTENDGKPFTTISTTDGANGLVYLAKKAGVPWLSGNVSVCRSGGASRDYLEKNLSHEQCPDAWVRLALPSTQSAHIVNNQIKLAGGGWGRNLPWSIIPASEDQHPAGRPHLDALAETEHWLAGQCAFGPAADTCRS